MTIAAAGLLVIALTAQSAPARECMIAPHCRVPPIVTTRAPDALPRDLVPVEGPPYRIVLRFLIVRRSDGSGGFDESLIHYFMRDLNYGYRNMPFVFVQSPDIVYIDDDALYENIPDWPTALGLLAQHHVPGVINHIITPTLFGGPPVTGLNSPWNPRGNLMAYHRVGQPDSIVYPPHEVGHVFWLYHPFETQFGAECTSQSNCAIAGDLVCDTPASPVVHGGNTTATGEFFARIPGPCPDDPLFAPLTDLYMEAGWPAGHILRDRFTQGQLDRSLNTLFTYSSDLIGPAAPAILVDCDGDSLDDLEQILAGAVADGNQDMVPDTCQTFPRPDDLLVTGMTPVAGNRVRYFDRETGAFRETMWNGMPWVHQLRQGPDGLVYLTSLTVVQRLDLATGRTRDNFIDGVLQGAGTFVDILWDAGGDVLLLDNVSVNIRKYDGETGQYIGVFSDLALTGMSSPKYMEHGPGGDIFVVNNGAAGNRVHRIDGRTGGSLGAFVSPGSGGLIAGQGLTFHDGFLYVSNAGGNNVLRYDGLTGDFDQVFVPSGHGGLSNPHSLRFGPDGHLYVASRNTDSVKRYDGETGSYMGDFVMPGADGLDQPTGLFFVPRTPGDIDGDGAVGKADLLALLAAWGACPGCPHDLDGDGLVGTSDLLALLVNWS